jgi:hypothetical protein
MRLHQVPGIATIDRLKTNGFTAPAATSFHVMSNTSQHAGHTAAWALLRCAVDTFRSAT